MGFSSSEKVPSKIGNRIFSSQPIQMGQIRFGRSHREIRGIYGDYNDKSIPDFTRKVALKGLRGCSILFSGVPCPEAERSWGSELAKDRVSFRSPPNLPSLLFFPSRNTNTPNDEDSTHLNSGLDPLPKLVDSSRPLSLLPTDLLSDLFDLS